MQQLSQGASRESFLVTRILLPPVPESIAALENDEERAEQGYVFKRMYHNQRVYESGGTLYGLIARTSFQS